MPSTSGCSAGGGIPLEPCALIDDGRACAARVQRRAVGRAGRRSRLGSSAGDGRLAAVRVYDDSSAAALDASSAVGPGRLRRRQRPADPSRGTTRRSPASQASRNPGVLRSQSGRISRVTARRSCQRSTDRGAPPEPVAVVDAVDDEPGLEHERVRDHRVVLGVGVLLDVEVPLDDAPRVGEERPLGADRGAELLERRGARRSRSWRSGCRPRRSSGRTRRARGAAGAPSGSSGRARA